MLVELQAIGQEQIDEIFTSRKIVNSLPISSATVYYDNIRMVSHEYAERTASSYRYPSLGTKVSRDSKSNTQGGNGRPAASQDTVEMVQQMFESEPRTSLRQAGRALGVPHATIHRILRRKLAMFPYKLQRLHAMHEHDYPRRVQFAQYCRAQRRRNSTDFLPRIVFSDECLFRVNGSVTLKM